MTGQTDALGAAAAIFFRLLAVAIGFGAAYAPRALGPIGLILLILFLSRGRRPLARVLAMAKRRVARTGN